MKGMFGNNSVVPDYCRLLVPAMKSSQTWGDLSFRFPYSLGRSETRPDMGGNTCAVGVSTGCQLNINPLI